MIPLLGFKHLSLISMSNVLGQKALLVVRFILSTSMPPSGILRVRAPNGYVFQLFCEDFFSEPGGGFFAIPWGTMCKGGGFGTGTAGSGGDDQLQPRDLWITLGPTEEGRLLSHKPYVF